MKIGVYGLLSLALAALLAAGCGGPDLGQPPPIKYGRDPCAECGMTIADERFAAGYYTQDGEARKFDDLGDLVLFLRKREQAPALVWVHDFETREWLPAAGAVYAVGTGVKAPHHGVAAFRSEAAARAYAGAIGARVMAWTDLLQLEFSGSAAHQHK